MEERYLTQEDLECFCEYLVREEKSQATIEKYSRDVKAFLVFVDQAAISKEIVVSYKKSLVDHGYAVASINSMLASVNGFLDFLGWHDCKVKGIKMQRKIYCPENRELTKAEYLRLLDAAKDQPQLVMIMQAICGTGIRVSELKYFTVDAIRQGQVCVKCKNKTRTVLFTGKLRKRLLDYAKKNGITTGPIFITKNGKTLDRSNIWARMKKLCEKAKVEASKVFPHNLRKLFAKTFYSIEKDIAKLADILGHSNIETTRIYIMTTSDQHRRKMERLGLVI